MIEPNTNPFELAKALSGTHWIGDRLVPAQSGKTFPVINPATGAEIGQAADGDAADIQVAVDAAKEAQRAWARKSARQRGKLVAECGRLLEKHVEELGRLVALESGKALRTESRVEEPPIRPRSYSPAKSAREGRICASGPLEADRGHAAESKARG